MIKNKEIDVIVNTTEGRRAIADSASIRSSAEASNVYYTTTLTAAEAIVASMKHGSDETVRRLQDLHGSIGK
jgi:carbamoyl-phosphate synthase large subunit